MFFFSIHIDGNWIPKKLEIIVLWVILKAERNGGHANDSKKHGGNSSVDKCYKAKVLKFRLSLGFKKILQVLVQHAHMWCYLDLDPLVPLKIHAAYNCKTYLAL